jgi:hypothetical protein
VAGVAGAAAMAVVTNAHADPRTAAEALFRDGTQLLEEGRSDAACPKLAESQKLDPALGTLFYLAACHEKQGRTASAWSEFTSATEWAQRSNQPERVEFGRKHLKTLEAKLSAVLIRATPVSGLELRVDDGLLSAAAIGTPLPLDPGSHVVEARAPGYEPWRTNVTVASDAETQVVTVPPLAAAAPPPAEAPSPAPATSYSAPRILTWTAGAATVAAVGVGAVFGGMTLSARDAAKSECPNERCSPGGFSDIDRARTDATVSTISFGVALTAALTTGVLWIWGDATPKARPPPIAGPSVVVSPTVAPHAAALLVIGRFE